MKWNDSVDAAGNQLLNPVIHSAATAPVDPVGGQMWFNSATRRLMTFDTFSGWTQVSGVTPIATPAVQNISVTNWNPDHASNRIFWFASVPFNNSSFSGPRAMELWWWLTVNAQVNANGLTTAGEMLRATIATTTTPAGLRVSQSDLYVPAGGSYNVGASGRVDGISGASAGITMSVDFSVPSLKAGTWGVDVVGTASMKAFLLPSSTAIPSDVVAPSDAHVLRPGQELGSSKPVTQLVSGNYSARVTSGTLRLYRGATLVWSLDSYTTGSHLAMQSDGVLALYPASGGALWTAGTSGSGNHLVLQTDGNLVVQHGTDNSVAWQSGTAGL